MISVLNGRAVKATYGSIIKEDAFLQLACNPQLKFQFEDKDKVEEGTIRSTIMNLFLEAYKLKDEIKKQDQRQEGSLKTIIIDSNRIERLLANRVLKNLNIDSKVLGPDEFSLRLMARFTPDFLIIDRKEADNILDLIWPSGRKEDDLPVIIYCDKEGKDLYSSESGSHLIDYVFNKKNLHIQIESSLKELFNFLPESI